MRAPRKQTTLLARQVLQGRGEGLGSRRRGAEREEAVALSVASVEVINLHNDRVYMRLSLLSLCVRVCV